MDDAGDHSIRAFPRRLCVKIFEFSGAVYGVEPNLASYDVAPDGRFLAARRDAVTADEIQVVLNWTDELRGLLKR